jgi:hypothetical protein
MHPPQKKVPRTYRVEGAIILYRPLASNLFKSEPSRPRAAPLSNIILGVPLFLRSLLGLVFVCPHWHKGPPITLRESLPFNWPGCRTVFARDTYITCLDCGRKFPYDHKSRRFIDFWGVRDPEALAEIRLRVVEMFAPLRSLAAWLGSRLGLALRRGRTYKGEQNLAARTRSVVHLH